MTAVPELWRNANQGDRDLITGYLRWQSIENRIVIPDLVHHEVFAFYHHREHFEFCGEAVRILKTKEDSDTMEVHDELWKNSELCISTVIGSWTIHSEERVLTSWELKASIVDNCIRIVGITSNWDDLNIPFYAPPKDKKYWNYGMNGFSGNKVSNNNFNNYGKKWGTDDVIKIELDLRSESKGLLTFYKNGISAGPAFTVAKGPGISYKLAIALSGKKNKIFLESAHQVRG